MMTVEEIKELFVYRDGALYWKDEKPWRKNGGLVGFKNNKGYLQAFICRKGPHYKKAYLVHRLIYKLHFGELPDYLDHIDGNPLNNSIENLRPVTKRQNCYNQKLGKDNKTGVKGVSFQESVGKYRADITVKGKQIYMGLYKTIEEAAEVVNAARLNLHKEYARFQ